jgi:hypothetical protein
MFFFGALCWFFRIISRKLDLVLKFGCLCHQKKFPLVFWSLSVLLAGGGNVEFVGTHGVSEVEECVLCMRCLCVGGREGSLGMCVLFGVMCILLAGVCFPLSPFSVLLFCVPKRCVWSAFLFALVQTGYLKDPGRGSRRGYPEKIPVFNLSGDFFGAHHTLHLFGDYIVAGTLSLY